MKFEPGIPVSPGILPSRYDGDSSRIGNVCNILLVFVLCSLWAAEGFCQDMSPRTFWPAPEGAQVAVLGYSRSTGDVLMDRSLPVNGVDSRINTGFFAYMQTFNLGGQSANLLVEQPYSSGSTEGLLFGQPAQSNFSASNDLSVTLTVNLIGAPSMNPAEFLSLRANPRPILGASIKVVAPTGEYDKDKLINVGANRWAVRTKLGSILPLTDKWLLELEAGAWFFGDDPDFLRGKREQDSIFSGEVHLVRRFTPGFWASLETTYFKGGRQTIGGEPLTDIQDNARIGATIVVPVADHQAIRVGASTGFSTDYGNDFNQFLVSWNWLL